MILFNYKLTESLYREDSNITIWDVKLSKLMNSGFYVFFASKTSENMLRLCLCLRTLNHWKLKKKSSLTSQKSAFEVLMKLNSVRVCLIAHLTSSCDFDCKNMEVRPL